MSLLYTNNAVSTLAAAAAIGATSLTLATGQGARFPVITPGNTFLLTLANIVGGVEASWEIVEVTARAADVLTVVRAREGTVAQAWPTGAPAEQRLTAGTLQTISRLPIVIVTATTQAAAANTHYALTNAAATTVTAPAAPIAGDQLRVSVCNGLTTNGINWAGLKHENISDATMVLDGTKSVLCEYINAAYGWKVTL